jgi:hypothetical protein
MTQADGSPVNLAIETTFALDRHHQHQQGVEP